MIDIQPEREALARKLSDMYSLGWHAIADWIIADRQAQRPLNK